MMKKLEFVLDTFTWLCFVLYCITGIFLHVGLDEELYYKLQMRENVPATAGISTEDLMHLDHKLARYLRGWDKLEADDESLVISVNGVMQPAFNEREIQHLQDCQRLFGMLSIVHGAFKWFFMTSFLIRWLLFYRVGRKQEGNNTDLWLSGGIVLVPLGILALWAAVDFSSAFTFFHKLLFTNDLWLLDPRTDLLINICPQSMFMSMGLRIALPSFGLLLGVPLLMTALNRIAEKRKRKQNEVSDL